MRVLLADNILTVSGDAPCLFGAIKAGALGYLLKAWTEGIPQKKTIRDEVMAGNF